MYVHRKISEIIIRNGNDNITYCNYFGANLSLVLQQEGFVWHIRCHISVFYLHIDKQL